MNAEFSASTLAADENGVIHESHHIYSEKSGYICRCYSREDAEKGASMLNRKHASEHAGKQGWVMVPEKLTARMREAMSSAMNDVFGSYPAYDNQRQDIWNAILAAAPDSAREGKK